MQLEPCARVLVASAAALDGHFPGAVENAVAVSDSVVRNDLFTTAPVFRLSCLFRSRGDGRDELYRPSGDSGAWRHLDPRGVVRPASVVQRGDWLVGKGFASFAPTTAEKKLLAASSGRAIRAASNPLLYEYTDPGTVVGVRLLAPSVHRCAKCGDIPRLGTHNQCPHCCGRQVTGPHEGSKPLANADFSVIVEVMVRRELREGDVLRDDRGNHLTVASIVPADQMPQLDGAAVDVWIAPASLAASALEHTGRLQHPSLYRKKTKRECRFDHLLLEKVTQRLEEKLTARSTGGYNLQEMPLPARTLAPRQPRREEQIIRQPAPELRPIPGQWLTRVAVRELLRAGYSANVLEMLTVKADAFAGHEEASAARTGDWPLPPVVPETAHRLVATLRALCFRVCFYSSDRREIDLQTAGRGTPPPTTLSVRLAGAAEIRALSHGQVQCNEFLNKRNHSPEQGGLLCERIFGPVNDSARRRRQFGHVELATPVVHPWFLRTIAEYLQLPLDVVKDVACYQQPLEQKWGRRPFGKRSSSAALTAMVWCSRLCPSSPQLCAPTWGALKVTSTSAT
jgi:hypothetical protein